jgi:anaerobic magnesium-protoporphyrin IX monomethyl ester cyclase
LVNFKKKIILISPTSDDFRKPLAEGQSGHFFPPMGLMLVAQTLKNHGYDVVIFDGNFDPDYKSAILKTIKENSSDIVFIGFYLAFLQIKDFIGLLTIIKSQWSQITTLVGGPFPAVFPEMTSEYDLIDIVCWGDGAEVSVQVADSIRMNKEWSEIPNICFKKNGKIQKNPKSISDSLHKDNHIHLEEFVDLEKYVHKFDVYLGRDKNPQIKRAMPILTGLGCSYKCTFCEHALMGNKHHALGAKDIVEQMNYYYNKYNIDSFAFFDEEFLSDKKRIFELTDLLKRNKNKFNWGTQVRASDVNEKYINKDRLQQIEDSGCIRFSMGVESGSPRMLKKIKKGLTPELVMRAANCGKDSKIVFSYSFIVNLPTETTEELQMTVNLAKKLLTIKPNSFVSAIHHYFAYPGTPLAIEAEERSGYRLEENFNLEGFANIDMPEYSQKVNPTLMDNNRESKIIHFEYSVLPYEFKLNRKAILRNSFKIIGRTRDFFNFYKFPIETDIRSLYLKFWSTSDGHANQRQLEQSTYDGN